MNERIAGLIGKTFNHKVNCFCISKLYFRETELRQVTADEILNFVAENFRQVEDFCPGTLTLIWSRSSFDLPQGHIKVDRLAKKKPGFPFGLILEHSFVQIDEFTALQKKDPTVASAIELVSLPNASAPYIDRTGFEMTRHNPIAEF